MVVTNHISDEGKNDTLQNNELVETTPKKSKKRAAIKSKGIRLPIRNTINFLFGTWLGREVVTIALYCVAVIGKLVIGLDCLRCLSKILRIDFAVYFLAALTVKLRAFVPIRDFVSGKSDLSLFCNLLPIMEFIVIFSLPLMKTTDSYGTILNGFGAALLMRLAVCKIVHTKIGTEAILTGIAFSGFLTLNLAIFSYFMEVACFLNREIIPTLLMVWLVCGLILLKRSKEIDFFDLVHALIGFPIIILNVVRDFKTLFENLTLRKLNALQSVCKVLLLSDFNLGLETMLLFSVVANIMQFVLTPSYKRGDRRHYRSMPFLFFWLLFFTEIISFILLEYTTTEFAPPVEIEIICDDSVSCINSPFNITCPSVETVEFLFHESCFEWPFLSSFIKLVGTAALVAVSLSRERKVVRPRVGEN